MNTTKRTHGARWLAKLLGLAQIVIGAIIVLTAIWLVVSFPLWWGDDAPRLPLPVEVAIQPEGEFLSLESAEAPFLNWNLERMSGDLKVVFVNPWAHTLYLFFGILELLIVFLTIWFLGSIVGSISIGEAFSPENAKRLRWVGGLFILEAIWGPGASTLIAAVALRGVEFTGGELSAPWFTDFGGGGFFTGWIILIISEVFRQGADMEREQSLTI